jgi:uncharacterized protein (TIGR00299 family) protein
MRIGYLECFSGISGDMLLGALVDAGVPFSVLQETCTQLGVGAHLHQRKVMRGGLTGTKVDVIPPGDKEHGHSHEGHSHGEAQASHSHGEHGHEAHAHSHADEYGSHAHSHAEASGHTHEHSHEDAHSHAHGHSHDGPQAHAHSHAGHRSLAAILGIIRSAPLAERVKQRSMRAFQLLGEAEAGIHSMPIEEVHFHEVGAVDTIVDIVCSAAGAEYLNVDRWLASPLNVGSGTVVCQHGTLPVPAPATLALLADAPVYADGPPMERVTPTGATILRMLDVEYAKLPTMRIVATGYGAGGRDTPGQPNLLRMLIGEQAAEISSASEPETEGKIAILETVIDDTNPQVIAYVSELLLAAGAWDVYRVAVQMKKGRTGVQLTVLCAPERVAEMRDLIFRETTTIGLHWRLENKIALAREFAEAQTPWGPVKIKIARWPNGDEANATPEYEDCKKIAAEHSIPLKRVIEKATQAYSALVRSANAKPSR